MTEALAQLFSSNTPSASPSPASPEQKQSSSRGSVGGIVGLPFAFGALLAGAVAFVVTSGSHSDKKESKPKSSSDKEKSPFQDYLDYRFGESETEEPTEPRRPPKVESKFARAEPHRAVQFEVAEQKEEREKTQEKKQHKSQVPDFSRLEGVSVARDFLPWFLTKLYPLSRYSPSEFKQLVQHLTLFFKREEALISGKAAADLDDNRLALADSRAAKAAMDQIIERNQSAGNRREFSMLRNQLVETLDHHNVNIRNLTRTIRRQS